MRLGWLAAAAAVMCAGQAGAETITQGFSATFTQNGSTGPVSVGRLDLGSNRVIRSATVFYDAITGLSAGYATLPGGPAAATISYTGSVGFAIFSLPVPIFASNSFSGTQTCSPGVCEPSFGLVGTLAVPDADLALFAGTTPLFIAPQGTINYAIDYDGRPALLMQQIRYSGVRGQIVYEVAAVPEPASWMLMIGGFALVGGAARRKRVPCRAAQAG